MPNAYRLLLCLRQRHAVQASTGGEVESAVDPLPGQPFRLLRAPRVFGSQLSRGPRG